MKTYSEKLKDPRWQRKRLEIMKRDKFACKYCRSTEKTLNVHHRIYGKGKAPWEYENHILITLCQDCHELAEIRKDSVIMSMGRYERQDEDMMLLAAAMNGDPDQLTFWGWALEQIAQAIRIQKIIELAENHDECLNDLAEVKIAAFDAIEHITTAYRALEKNNG